VKRGQRLSTVADLKKALEGVDENLPLVHQSSDHSYRQVNWAYEVDAEDANGDYYEYFSEEHLISRESKKARVFLIDIEN